jgi:hypothetical protein
MVTAGTASTVAAATGTAATELPRTLAGAAADRGDEQVPKANGNQPTGGKRTATKATGQQVDGIGCNTSEQTLFHPAGIPLTKHAQIQLEVGSPLVAPEKITFPNGL